MFLDDLFDLNKEEHAKFYRELIESVYLKVSKLSPEEIKIAAAMLMVEKHVISKPDNRQTVTEEAKALLELETVCKDMALYISELSPEDKKNQIAWINQILEERAISKPDKPLEIAKPLNSNDKIAQLLIGMYFDCKQVKEPPYMVAKLFLEEFPADLTADSAIVFYIIKRMDEYHDRKLKIEKEKEKQRPSFLKSRAKQQEWYPFQVEFDRLIEDGKAESWARNKIGVMIENLNTERISKGQKPICTKSENLRPDRTTLLRQLKTKSK